MDSNVRDKIVLDQPKTDDARREAAKILVERLEYRMPVGLDPIDDRAGRAFSAWPERIYIMDKGGRVIYKGGMGPFEFHPDEAERALADHLGVPVAPRSSPSPTPPS
jgi:type I thyroxine 5'-deiodinase